jgi:hypothetical protein
MFCDVLHLGSEAVLFKDYYDFSLCYGAFLAGLTLLVRRNALNFCFLSD